MTVSSFFYAVALFAFFGLALRLLARERGARAALALADTVSAERWVGPYALQRKLGAGGMGEVYRARSVALDRELAVKLVPAGASSQTLQRFEQEGRLGAELCHPNAAAIYACGESDDGTHYIAMELVEGETVQQLVERQGPLPPARVIHIARQLCAALGHLHGRGLVHRDIKPANVIVTARDGVKIVDFGLVERIGAALEPNAIVGTPLYLSPEAIRTPSRVDERSDLYGLGAVMYFMLLGKPVFGGKSALEVCAHHLHSPPVPPSVRLGRPLPAALERVVLDCLAKDEAGRPRSAAELGARLLACSAHRRRDRPRLRGLSSATMGARSPLDDVRRARASRAPAHLASRVLEGGAAPASRSAGPRLRARWQRQSSSGLPCV